MKHTWINRVVLALLAASLGAVAAQAQGAGAKPAPRMPDGKPDLSGVWTGGGGDAVKGDRLAPQSRDKGTAQHTRWGQEKFTWNRGPEEANAEGVYAGQHVRLEYDPAYHCYPLGLVRLGPPIFMISGGSNAMPVRMEWVQTPAKLIMIYEYRNSVRQIYLDGRKHPENVEATWNGHSIGHWEGDTLVVDTVGLREESWLDTGGNEHSNELHVLEKIRRLNFDTLEIERTITDPIALVKPMVQTVTVKLNPNVILNENMDGRQFDCQQFMVRKDFFGEGENTLLGISEPTKEPY